MPDDPRSRISGATVALAAMIKAAVREVHQRYGDLADPGYLNASVITAAMGAAAGALLHHGTEADLEAIAKGFRHAMAVSRTAHADDCPQCRGQTH